MSQFVSSAMKASLPFRCYTDSQFFDQECDELFRREWMCAAREEDLSEPNRTMEIELLGESVIVARLADGSLRAHQNICRHRGAKLCGSDVKWGLALNGGVDRGFIRCPYHQWTYGLDGALVNAPHLTRSDDFKASDFSLIPVGIATWGGFIFLKLRPEVGDEHSRTLEVSDIGLAPQRLGNYPLKKLKTAHTIKYEVGANWKVIAENYNECYHCSGVHPELCEIVPAFRKKGGLELDWENGVPHREGAWTYTFNGTSERKPFDGLDEYELVRHKGELVYPNMMLSMSAEHGAAFVLWPIAADKTVVECRFLFDPSEMAKPNFDGSDAIDFWDITNRQDWAVCERVQQGMSTRVIQHGWYAPMEDESLDIRKYLSEKLSNVEF